jgi:hypothetical protein
MKKLKICKENLPKILQIISKTLLQKGKFVRVHEIKRGNPFGSKASISNKCCLIMTDVIKPI